VFIEAPLLEKEGWPVAFSFGLAGEGSIARISEITERIPNVKTATPKTI